MLIFLSFSDSSEQSFFEKLYYKYRQQMYFVAFRILSNESDAEDAVQNAFLKIVNHIPRLKGLEENSLRAFLLTVAKNSAIDLLRATSKELLLEDENAIINFSDGVNVESRALEKIELQKIVSAIESLSEPYKSAMSLFFVYDLPCEAVADLLGRNSATVRKQIQRGKGILINILKVGEDNEAPKRRADIKAGI